jgi:plasmid stabilization system protein ParE
MKTYTVNVTDEVVADIRHAFFYIYERSPQNASTWIRNLYKAIDTLESMPERCPIIREHEAFDEELRNLIFQSHRIIFTINDENSTVQVHAFRHAAQDDMRPE